MTYCRLSGATLAWCPHTRIRHPAVVRQRVDHLHWKSNHCADSYQKLSFAPSRAGFWPS